MKNKPQLSDRITTELLVDLGLISKEQVKEGFSADGRPKKRLVEILKQDVTLGSIKELMTFEIPFSTTWKRQGHLQEMLVEQGLLDEGEVAKVMEASLQIDQELHHFMQEESVISETQFDQAAKLAQEAGIPVWRALINLNYLTPRQLTEFAKERQSSQRNEPRKRDLFVDALEKRGFLKKAAAERVKTAQLPYTEFIPWLLNEEHVPLENLAKTMEEEFQIPRLSLDTIRTESAAFYSLPDSLVQRHQAIPVQKTEDRLQMAMVNPFDENVMEQVRLITGLDVSPALISKREFDTLFQRFYDKRGRETKTATVDGAIVEDSSAVELVASIIEGSIKARATDIHFEPHESGMRIRYRIDGMLYDITTIPEHQQLAVISRLKILGEMDITDRRRPQDGHFTLNLPDHRYNLRIATLPTYLGEKLVIRILDETKVVQGIQQLGLPTTLLAVIENLVHRPHGMILVTGPMGSGKTTTLYASLNELDILHQNIITIEDPVEYQLPGINQIQVNLETGMTFPAGLRAVLRQDADVIMVGEIRDAETAQVAVWAALTGQLVLSTLHTNDTAGAITMLSNLKIPRYLIAGAVVGIISQRLVRRLCPHCKEPFIPDRNFLQFHNIEHLNKPTFFRAVGCKECLFTGYRGLTGVFEMMPVSETLRHEILNETGEAQIKEVARSEGMKTLFENGVQKVLDGEITVEEIHRKIMR